MTAFTYLWTNECRLNMLEDSYEGDPLSTSAGSAFTKRGVKKGDIVFVIAVHDGDVYLIGRKKIIEVWDREDYDDEHENPTLWEGTEVIVGEAGTPMRFEYTIPPAILAQLRFTNRSDKTWGLSLNDGKLIEPQSLRSVHCLHWESIGLLNNLLE